MHGISKPDRNIFELSVLLNYFLTRYSGSDGKVPSLFFLFSIHTRCLARPVCILFPAFHLLPRTVPLWNMKPCQLLGPASLQICPMGWRNDFRMMERPCLPVHRNSSSSQGLGAYRLRFVPCSFCKLGVRRVSQVGVIPDQHFQPHQSPGFCPSQSPLLPP